MDHTCELYPQQLNQLKFTSRKRSRGGGLEFLNKDLLPGFDYLLKSHDVL